MQRSRILLVLLFFPLSAYVQAVKAASPSVYPERPEDPAAIYADGSFRADLAPGRDVTASLQAAIDTLAERATFGLVLIPSGEYRLTDTLYLWKGIRLIGYGPTRPRFILPAGTPGYAGETPKYLFHFASNRPGPGEPFRDANPGTFYSALSNVEIVIEPGNPMAVGVRSHFAQHSFLAHVRFEIGDGLAGVQKVGNLFHDLEFIGGRFGIMTTKPSPSWPFTLLDSTFSGQRQAAIQTEEAGLTIVRCRFSDSPRAIEVRPERSEELYIEGSVFERLPEGIALISEVNNARTQVNFVDLVAEEVPLVVRLRETGETVAARAGRYGIAHFSHGLHLDGLGREPVFETRLEWAEPGPAEAPLAVAVDPARALPPSDHWVNVVSLGAVGDGEFDNTALLQAAIEAHETLYFPSGRYRLSDTLRLRPETVLVGLSPITTQLMLADEDPGFHPVGVPRAVVESASGGAAILQGIGIEPGGINDRAFALKWRAGAHSMVRDVRFLGGHGTFDTAGNYLPIYNNNRSGDSDPRRRWDVQPASLWVTEGGGGSFVGLWTPSPFAHAGMMVENTTTPGWVYQMSSEHHLRNEVIVRDAANWSFYGLQFEEENWEGRHTLPLLIERSRDLVFNNTWIYRVSRTFTPYPEGILVRASERLDFRGVHLYGPSKYLFDATLREADSGQRVLSREIARMRIPGARRPAAAPLPLVELASGFNHLESPEVDAAGRLYFLDARAQSIYRWDPATEMLRLLLDAPLEPSQIVLSPDETELIILTRVGRAFRLPLEGGAAGLTELAARQGPPPEGARYVIPMSRWRDGHDFLDVTQEPKPAYFEAAGLIIPAEQSYLEAGPRTTHFRTLDLERSYDLAAYAPGESLYVADEFGQKTWRFTMGPNGRLADPVLFAEEGEVGTLVLPDGRIVVGAGELFVYHPDGTLQRRLEVPARVTGLALGGPDHSTLFILARTRLWSLPLGEI